MDVKAKGIPLNEDTLSNMDEEERSFWEGFLKEAQENVERCKMTGATKPYMPSDSLRNQFVTAIMVFDGEQYCQVRQLIEIFDFNP